MTAKKGDLIHGRTGPTHFGPSAEACTPWLQIALCCLAQSGPRGVVLVCGQRLWHLPPQLQQASHVLLWPWDLDSVRALVGPAQAAACWSLPVFFLLFVFSFFLFGLRPSSR